MKHNFGTNYDSFDFFYESNCKSFLYTFSNNYYSSFKIIEDANDFNMDLLLDFFYPVKKSNDFFNMLSKFNARYLKLKSQRVKFEHIFDNAKKAEIKADSLFLDSPGERLPSKLRALFRFDLRCRVDSWRKRFKLYKHDMKSYKASKTERVNSKNTSLDIDYRSKFNSMFYSKGDSFLSDFYNYDFFYYEHCDIDNFDSFFRYFLEKATSSGFDTNSEVLFRDFTLIPLENLQTIPFDYNYFFDSFMSRALLFKYKFEAIYELNSILYPQKILPSFKFFWLFFDSLKLSFFADDDKITPYKDFNKFFTKKELDYLNSYSKDSTFIKISNDYIKACNNISTFSRDSIQSLLTLYSQSYDFYISFFLFSDYPDLFAKSSYHISCFTSAFCKDSLSFKNSFLLWHTIDGLLVRTLLFIIDVNFNIFCYFYEFFFILRFFDLFILYYGLFFFNISLLFEFLFLFSFNFKSFIFFYSFFSFKFISFYANYFFYSLNFFNIIFFLFISFCSFYIISFFFKSFFIDFFYRSFFLDINIENSFTEFFDLTDFSVCYPQLDFLDEEPDVSIFIEEKVLFLNRNPRPKALLHLEELYEVIYGFSYAFFFEYCIDKILCLFSFFFFYLQKFPFLVYLFSNLIHCYSIFFLMPFVSFYFFIFISSNFLVSKFFLVYQEFFSFFWSENIFFCFGDNILFIKLKTLLTKVSNFFINSIFLDSAVSMQLNFQDPSTPISEGINDLHHYINYFLIIIFFLVLFCLRNLYKHFFIYPSIFFGNVYGLLSSKNKKLNNVFISNLFAVRFFLRFLKTIKKNHDYVLEIVWTCIPSLILVLIAIPSFSLLYAMDEVINPAMSIKVIGRQWYWSYEYFDFLFKSFVEKVQERFSDFTPAISFDSYMIPEDELLLGDLRLLEVDNPVLLPKNTHIRVIVTAGDVLHSWAVPSLGIKLDAVPGRLNQTAVFIKRSGTFYGQCSEICGTNHGFMPIVVQSVSLKDYISWFLVRLEESFS